MTAVALLSQNSHPTESRGANRAGPQPLPLRLAQPRRARDSRCSLKSRGASDARRLSQRVHFERDGTVSIASGKVELGQGILTALAQIAAEELGVPLEKIRMLPASTAYSPDEGVTSGSQSIQEGGKALRAACAELRALMLERAARSLGAPLAELKIEDGTIRGRGEQGQLLGSCRFRGRDSGRRAAQAGERLPRRRHERAAPRPAGQVRRPAELRAGHGAAGDAAWPRGAAAPWLSKADHRCRSRQAPRSSVTAASSACWPSARKTRSPRRRSCARSARGRTGRACPDDIHAWLKQHVAERIVAKEKSDPAAKARGVKRVQAAYTKPYIAHASIGPSCALARWKGEQARGLDAQPGHLRPAPGPREGARACARRTSW